MYRKMLRIRSSMELLQKIDLVNANTIRDQDLIHTRGKKTMRDPKMTTSVIVVAISRILLRIIVLQSIGCFVPKVIKGKQAPRRHKI